MGSSGSSPAAPPSSARPAPRAEPNPEFEKPWRKFDWGEKAALKQRLETFVLRDSNVNFMGIMIVGQIGAGKSSFINSVNNALLGRITSGALVDSSAGSSRSFTLSLKTHRVKTANAVLPFVFRDIMGLEALSGSQPEDIINAISGHVKEGYKFNHEVPLSYGDEYYNSNPSVSERAFCLVYIVAADTIQFIDERLCEKLRIIRKRISDKGIPQVLVMTKVDAACHLVCRDLKKIYTSKKIKEKMQLCSDKVGMPMNHIFPVKNYHDEIDTDDDVDVLILKAFEQIVQLAYDRLVEEGFS